MCITGVVILHSSSAKGLGLIPSASRGCPKGQTGHPDLRCVEPAWLQGGFLSASLQSLPPRLVGRKCELPVIPPDFPGSLDERAQASWGAEPCLVACPSHAERLFHWRITAASTSWFTGRLSAVRDGRERREEPSRFWRFCRERKSLFFPLYPS